MTYRANVFNVPIKKCVVLITQVIGTAVCIDVCRLSLFRTRKCLATVSMLVLNDCIHVVMDKKKLVFASLMVAGLQLPSTVLHCVISW